MSDIVSTRLRYENSNKYFVIYNFLFINIDQQIINKAFLSRDIQSEQ